MPSELCAEDVSGSTCCDSFWMIGERIRTVASHGIVACFDDDCGGREFASYQSEGPVTNNPNGESLIINFTRASIKSGSRTTNGAVRPIIATRAEYRVELLENGWPILEVVNGTIIPPDLALIHAYAKHARGHAEKLWRSLIGAAGTTDQSKALFPAKTNPHVLNRGVQIGDLTPMARPGPQIGFQLTVTVDTMLP